MIRADLVEALRLDLVGPDNAHAFAHELLPESPTRWYLTGLLVPRNAPEEQRADPEGADEIDSGDDSAGDDGAPPNRAAAGKSYLPSSMGLSVLVAPGVEQLEASVVWGDYQAEELVADEGGADAATGASDAGAPNPDAPVDAEQDDKKRWRWGYRRTPREERVTLPLPAPDKRPRTVEVPASRGLRLVVTCRAVPSATNARHWPWNERPAVYFYPRSLDEVPANRGSLHAKCVLVDGRAALITSANFTEAAQ